MIIPNTCFFFSDSVGLINLELQGNPLEPVTGPFLTINSLFYLDLSNCSLSKLNQDFFANTTHLSTLDLSENPFVEIHENVFKPLGSLETLKMNHCNLTHIGDDVFVSLSVLKHLELEGNNFKEVNWEIILNKLHLLQTIDLRRSQINHLPETMFHYNLYLTVILVSNNDLAGLNIGLLVATLQNLETLDLSDCNLTLPLSEDAFAKSTKIRNLYLSGNKLFASDLLLVLSPLTDLEKLSLSNCGLSRLPDTFGNFKSLQELDISHNPLDDAFVKLLAPLETLEYLNMGYSNLSYIHPESFAKMTSMKRLVLSGNDLDGLAAGLFANLAHLESLELNFCGLVRPLNATVFFNNFTYTDLTELYLSGNPLHVSKTGTLLPKQLSRLRILDLSNCNLKFLPKEAFHYTRNITTLILSGNHFASPSNLEFLALLPQLHVLDVRFNDLTTITPNEFALNPDIEKLKLVGNPWKCSCNIANMWDWVQLEKRNLEVLEGATVTQGDVSVGKVKRKQLLLCHFDRSSEPPISLAANKIVSGRRPFLNPSRNHTAFNRTWAKYVRESGCEQLQHHKRERRAAVKYDHEILQERYENLGVNTWASAAINAMAFYAIAMTILGVVYIATRETRALERKASSKKRTKN